MSTDLLSDFDPTHRTVTLDVTTVPNNEIADLIDEIEIDLDCKVTKIITGDFNHHISHKGVPVADETTMFHTQLAS